MKIAILLLPLLFCFQAFAQTDFSRADSTASCFKETFTDAADLAKKLTRSFQTEPEKARVIFMWIAHNIRYDVRKYRNPPPYPHITGYSQEEIDKKVEEWRASQMRKTLRSKKGVCQDYSELFKAMCDAVGLEAEIVPGHARDFYKPYRNVQDNAHAWNAVKIGGEWNLIDATWAAGYVNPEVTKFTRHVSPGYFAVPPAWFVQSHLPENENWQLLDPPVGKKSFPDQPLINFGQMDYPVEDFSSAPQKDASDSRKFEIRLKFSKSPVEFMLTTGNSRPIDFEKQTEDGWVVLRFSSKRVRDVIVFGGESQRNKMDWLARYEVR